MPKPKQIAGKIHPMVLECLALRQKLADAELWATYQVMDMVLNKIGWELAGDPLGPRGRDKKNAAYESRQS